VNGVQERTGKLLRSTVKWVLSIVIGVLFVHLAMNDWPAGDMLAGGVRLEGWLLATDTWRVHIGWFPLYFLTLVSMHIFRVWRWQPLLDPIARVGFWDLNRVCSVGFLAVFVLPIRVGEFVRPALLSTTAHVRKSAGLATIVVERVIDGVMVAGFLAVALVFMPRTNASSFTELRIGTLVALALFAGLVLMLVLMFVFRTRLTSFIQVVSGRLSGRLAVRLTGMTDRFTQGLAVFPDAKKFLWFLFLSFLYWTSNGIGLYILAYGFGLGQVGLLGAFAMMSTIVVGMMIPNAPANVGTFWYFLLKPTELYGVTAGNPAALAYALAVWSLQLLQLVIFGGWYILRGDVSMRRAFVPGATPDDEAGTDAAT